MQTNLGMHKVHYHGTWESPKLPLGQWHVEQKGNKFFCFYNGKLMHLIREGRDSLSLAIQFCEDHYHQLLGEQYDGKISDQTLK